MVDCRGSAKLHVAFQNKNTMSGPGIKGSRSQPPEAGADHDRIELSRHGNLSYDEPDCIFACRHPFISALIIVKSNTDVALRAVDGLESIAPFSSAHCLARESSTRRGDQRAGGP